ncbi:MAG: dicarboxylate/amino acid:cation symporter, partial [Eubacterium sp.]
MKKFKGSMTTQILIAMVIGIGLGIIFGDKIAGIKILGDIFLRLIQMSVVLLVMGAVIESVGHLDTGELGRLGGKMFFLFMLSTLVAAALGIFLGEIFIPGADIHLIAETTAEVHNTMNIHDIVLDFFPTNIMEAMMKGSMIQVIVFSLLFGIALSAWCKQKGDTMCGFFGVLQDFNGIILKMVGIIMTLAPIGIGALLAYTTGTIGIQVILPLVKFLGVLALGTIIHLSVLIVAVSLYCFTNPLRVSKKLANMTIVAFTTTSSVIALPVKMADSEKKLGVSKKISDLVNPLGMTLNSNGLAIFLSLSCLTIAQIYGIDLTATALIKVVVISTLSCLGTVVVPGGGLVALTMVIPSLGLPLESIALLSGIDWFSGMFRTVLNVDIDALVAM